MSYKSSYSVGLRCLIGGLEGVTLPRISLCALLAVHDGMSYTGHIASCWLGRIFL